MGMRNPSGMLPLAVAMLSCGLSLYSAGKPGRKRGDRCTECGCTVPPGKPRKCKMCRQTGKDHA